MQKVREFRQRAEECRRLADESGDGDLRRISLQLARSWDEIAAMRQEWLARRTHRPPADGENQSAAGLGASGYRDAN